MSTTTTTPALKLQENIQHARMLDGSKPYTSGYANIGTLLAERAGSLGEKTWLVYYSDETGRHEYSYRALYERVCRTAHLLLDNNVRRGDRIATVAYNHYDTVVQYFAAFLIGAVVVPINVGEDDKRIGFILENSQAKLVFVRDQFTDRILSILAASPSRPVTIITVSEPGTNRPVHPGCLDFETAIQQHPPTPPDIAPFPSDSDALIVYTSGTTGLPKGVLLSQENLMVDARAIAEWHTITADQRMMCVLPIHHVNGTVVTLMTPLYAGGSVVLNQKFHSAKFFERIAAERANVVSVVPTLLQFLLHEHRNHSAWDISSLRHIICGAGPLTVELALQFEDRFGIPIMHGYGLSETTCYSCFLPLDLSGGEHRHWLKDFGFPSIGIPIPPNDMAIHAEDGSQVPEGSKGEIVIRGYNVMKEYYANREANEKSFTHGWFRSGDEGFFQTDEAGRRYFFITGRIKELIIRGGINISPFEIDEVLMNIPGVKAGLAVGFDNDWYGEEIGAYIQRAEGSSVTADEVIAHCRKHFSFAKSPKIVLFGKDIPVTSTGKYQRNTLKPLFEEWKAVQFSERKA